MNPYKQLTLNSQHYNYKKLLEYCNGKLLNSSIPAWESEIFRFILDWISESGSITVTTSGSTEKPGEINLSKHNMIASAMMTGEFFGLKKGNTALLCLPANYIAGKMMIVRAFVLGLNLITCKPASVLLNIPLPIDFAAVVPIQLEYLSHKISELSKIKKVIVGGAPVNLKILSKINQKDTEIIETYGMTETITHVAVRRIYPEPEHHFSAMPGVSFGVDNRGCLTIYASHLFDGFITTNDLVQFINSVKFKFIGRYDYIINSGGIKINPELVEQKLQDYIKERFIVTSVPDEKLGEKVVLVIEKKNTTDVHLEMFKKEFLNKKYEIPKAIYFLDHFPETESGKINRKVIRIKIIAG